MCFLASGVQIPLLTDVIIILGLAVLVILAFNRLRVPPIVGYLITGIVAGPYVLGLIEAGDEVEMLAEIGVVLLMFTIGLELSLKNLLRIWRSVFILGGLQVGVVLLVTALAATQFGLGIEKGIFLGFLAALSSTAIVLKTLQQNLELDTLHGRNVLAILIFQDIIVVPMMLATPLLAGQAENVGLTVLLLVAKFAGLLGGVVVLSRYVMPWVLLQVAKTRSRELFILTMVAICFAVAWGTAQIELSLALGAFLAGLIVSESEYSHQATSDILPFRELFASFFFVSVGMLLDVNFFAEHPFVILLVTLLVMLLKFGLVAGVALAFRLPFRTVLLVGLMLAQVGEFSFILSKTGLEYKLLTGDLYQYFLAVSITTMALTPFLVLGAQRISSLILRTPLPEQLKQRLKRTTPDADTLNEEANEVKLEDHLIIIGFGVSGQNLAKVAHKANIPYVILETNPDTVRTFQRKGEPILFGDASAEHILEHVHPERARVAVVAITDLYATQLVVAQLRQLSPNLHIIARTRFLKQAGNLLSSGASEVVPEEFESTIEIFSRTLNRYLIPKEEIEEFARSVRIGSYERLRNEEIWLPENAPRQESGTRVEVSTFRVPAGSWLAHKSLQELKLRQQYGLNVVAIRRNEQLIAEIQGETTLHPLDELFVFGQPDNVNAFCQSLR